MFVSRIAVLFLLCDFGTGVAFSQGVIADPANKGGFGGAARQPQAPAEVKPEDRASVEGAVINGRTDQPIRKAVVQFMRQDARVQPNTIGTVTDAAGRFVVKDMEPGAYIIRVTRTGFAAADFGSQQRSSATSPSMINLKARQEMKGLVYKLLPGAVITGRVVDDEGDPVANARVLCMRYRYVQGRRQLVPSGTMDGGGGTDDNGQFRIFGLAGGRYYLSANYFDYRSANIEMRGAGNETYGTVYYPGVLDPSQSSALTIREGEERGGIDFKLIKTRTFRVRGRLLTDSGRKAQMGMVYLTNRGSYFNMQQSMAQVRSDGTFELRGVASGAYVLMGFSSDAGEQLTIRQAIDVANDNLDGLEIVLRSGLEIKGQVKLEDGTPDQSFEGIRVMLRPKEEGPMMGGGFGMVEKDGSFAMKRVAGGNYRVFVMGAGQNSFYLKSARYGEQDATDGLTIGDAPAELEVTLSAAGGKVDGAILDDQKKPAVGAMVVLVPDGAGRSNPDLYKNATTDQDGRYSLTGIKPGEYKLFAWEKVENGAWMDPAFLEAVEGKGKKVKLEKAGYQTVELELLPMEEK